MGQVDPAKLRKVARGLQATAKALLDAEISEGRLTCQLAASVMQVAADKILAEVVKATRPARRKRAA